MNLRSADAADAPAMAQVHAQAFDRPWGQAALEEVLAGEGVFALMAGNDDPDGFVVCRALAGEAEILTIAVAPQARRRGIAQALMVAALGAARACGAETAFLEVGVDNAPAVALYEGLGFERAGLRRGYYDRGQAGHVDALVMRLDLGTQGH